MGYFYLFLFVGIFYLFGNIFTSGWDIIASGLVDGQLTNYILEHFYLIVTGGSQVHTQWWSLPIFYPMQNTLATTDTLFSVAPIYILYRSLTDYSMAYSMTIITFYILNFSVFYFILRRLNFSKALSSFGAFLYAFSYINKITEIHIQMTTQFFYLGAVLALLNVSKFNSRTKNLILFLVAGFLYACQFYSSFYLAFFIYYLTLLAMFISLFDKKLRKRLKIFILRYKKEIIASGLFAITLILPAVIIYLQTGITRDYDTIMSNVPYLKNLFSGNTLFINKYFPGMQYSFDVENMLMFTYGLFILGTAGLLKFKRYGKLAVLTLLLSIITIIKFGILHDFTLWKYVYKLVPGATAVREPIRFVLMLNALLVLGFVNFLSKTQLKRFWILLIIVFMAFEQYTPDNYNHRTVQYEDKKMMGLERVPIPVNCKYIDVNFILDPNMETDIYTALKMEMARLSVMWYATKYNLYCVSGYAGISEVSDYGNPYRDILQKDKNYCVITKYLSNEND